MTDFTKNIADHETAKGEERLANEIVDTPVAGPHPGYQALLIAAASVDMDNEALRARVDRIHRELLDLAAEAIRVRDQHEAQIEGLKKGVVVYEPAPPTATSRRSTTNDPKPPPPVTIPPTLVHWIRRQVALHPVAIDGHPILTAPNVTLGELRAFLTAYDLAYDLNVPK